MWLAGAFTTILGVGMVGMGAYAAFRREDQTLRWYLSRGSVVLVLGILLFTGVPSADGGPHLHNMSLLMIAASAVSAMVVLSLSEETMREGSQTQVFITRPASRSKSDAQQAPSRPPILSRNRRDFGEALHPAAKAREERVEEAV